MLIKDVMTQNVVSVSGDDSALEVAKMMSKYNIGAVPVTDGAAVKGILTDRDIVLRCVAQDRSASSCKACDIMSGSTTYVSPNQSVGDALQIMSAEQIRRLPVVENGNLVGMVSLGDIAKIKADVEVSEAICEISKP